MLKKNDLVKQFELVVKQEIIEHNKAISSSNLVINKHKEYVEEELKKIKNNHRLLVNEYALVSEQFFNAKNQKEGLLNEISKLGYESFNKIEENVREIKVIDKSIETVHSDQKIAQKSIASLQDDVRSLKEAIDEIKKSNSQTNEQLSYKILKSIKRLKIELLTLPSEVLEVKKEFMEELSRYKVDNAGLIKEILVIKKVNTIQDKKIENLYTLIERMKSKN